MEQDRMDRPIKERFDYLLNILHSEKFLKMKGLGKEVPFYICPYDPKENVEMLRLADQLRDTLAADHGVQVLMVNLYDLSLELLRERGILERILEEEPNYSKGELKELLQGVLDPEAHIIPAISNRMKQTQFDILFITGVGEVFPYIRSHNVLNNLQSAAKAHPTVMFFPGEYKQSLEEGASLDLFDKLHDDRYYRAFNIYHAQ
jgi:hypothetical protein